MTSDQHSHAARPKRPRPDRRLTRAARQHIGIYGFTAASWARQWFVDGEWYGDRCGCTDDRCIGYHHDEYEPCGCIDGSVSYLRLTSERR